MRQQKYHFIDRWRVQAPNEVVAAALLQMRDWSAWWPYLQQAISVSSTIAVGTTFATRWRSPVGYALNFTATITAYNPGKSVAFTVAGDLVGQGSMVIAEAATGSTKAVIDWEVRTTKWWMNLLGVPLRPLFAWQHDQVMRAGERGLQQYVKDNRG